MSFVTQWKHVIDAMFAVVLTSMLCCFKIAALFVSSFVNRSIFWVRSCPGASQIQNAEWRSLARYVVKHRVKHLELLFTFLNVSCSCDPDWWGDQCLYMHTLKLILCCNTFGFYCSTQSFWVGADQFGASWCGKFAHSSLQNHSKSERLRGLLFRSPTDVWWDSWRKTAPGGKICEIISLAGILLHHENTSHPTLALDDKS